MPRCKKNCKLFNCENRYLLLFKCIVVVLTNHSKFVHHLEGQGRQGQSKYPTSVCINLIDNLLFYFIYLFVNLFIYFDFYFLSFFFLFIVTVIIIIIIIIIIIVIIIIFFGGWDLCTWILPNLLQDIKDNALKLSIVIIWLHNFQTCFNKFYI